MPVGIIVNMSAVIIGGLLGAVCGNRLKQEFKDAVFLILGCSSMAMGVASIVLMKNLTAVIFATVFGTAVGSAIHIGNGITRASSSLQNAVSKILGKNGASEANAEQSAMLLTAIVLFCSSGTGVYGSLYSGFTADHTILFTKAILDFVSSFIFACNLGFVISTIAIPQSIVMLTLFFLAKLIMPLTTDSMIADFKACGGIIMLATGFRIAKIKMFPIADMLPAMLLVMPVSALWEMILSAV